MQEMRPSSAKRTSRVARGPQPFSQPVRHHDHGAPRRPDAFALGRLPRRDRSDGKRSRQRGSGIFALLFAADPTLSRGDAIARVYGGTVDLGRRRRKSRTTLSSRQVLGLRRGMN
jgi:hypothetical protein